MNYIVYPVAVLGFISGISAYTQIKSLKERITKLEEEINEITG